ncbi:MAG: ADP-ribosylglycohydrolase family protein, partial [Bacteriovoracaceae bacterium]|nr:ADP-ribosylglycohydrolase family protein [Bacteriovoracaceae bacterium]
MNTNERKLGCLLGLHIGDSLGAPLEFMPPREKDDWLTEMEGGGQLNWLPGEPTDDTTMMLMLLESLAIDPSLDVYDLSSRFIDWKMTDPKDMGRTTYYAIMNMIDGKGPGQWGLTGEFDQGNGSLMRCAPLSLVPFNKEIINKQTAMTHNTLNCKASDEVFIAALQDAYEGLDKKMIYENALERTPNSCTKMKEYLRSIPYTPWEELETSGYVLHTLRAAFWSLFHTDSF